MDMTLILMIKTIGLKTIAVKLKPRHLPTTQPNHQTLQDINDAYPHIAILTCFLHHLAILVNAAVHVSGAIPTHLPTPHRYHCIPKAVPNVDLQHEVNVQQLHLD